MIKAIITFCVFSVGVFANEYGVNLNRKLMTRSSFNNLDGEGIEIYCHNGSKDSCYELSFYNTRYRKGLKVSSDLISILPAAVEANGAFYNLQPQLNEFSWIFGIAGKLLYPVQKNVWNGIPEVSMQMMAPTRSAKRLLTKVFKREGVTYASRKSIKNVVSFLSTHGDKSNSEIIDGAPEGVREGWSESVMNQWLLGL